MTDKELRHLGREALLQLLIERTTEIDELKSRVEQLESELLQAKSHPAPAPAVLPDIQEAGSIAEAALRVNHVFEDAQKAADQYLSTILRMQREQALRCKKLMEDAQQEADFIINEAYRRAQAIDSASKPRSVPFGME